MDTVLNNPTVIVYFESKKNLTAHLEWINRKVVTPGSITILISEIRGLWAVNANICNKCDYSVDVYEFV